MTMQNWSKFVDSGYKVKFAKSEALSKCPPGRYQNIYPKYLDRQAWTNSVYPDQMPHSVASDLGLHC